MAEPRQMRIRRPDVCASCATQLPAGTEAIWFAAARVVRCLGCRGAGPRNIAGRSAQVEYERRSGRERERAERAIDEDASWRRTTVVARPVLGRLVTGLTPKPRIGPESAATTAWKLGAEGERQVAAALVDVAGIEVLHDRRIPGTRANIDHVVVAESGVFIVDAKRYTGRIEIRDRGGVLRSDPRLYVNGRDRTSLVDGVVRQVAVVRNALGAEHRDVDVHGVVCFVDGSWPLLRRGMRVGDVDVVSPAALARRVGRPADLRGRVAEIAGYLGSTLRPA